MKTLNLRLKKTYQKLPFLDALTTKTNKNRINNTYTEFMDAGSLINYLSFTATKYKSCIAKILVDWLYKILNNTQISFHND